MGEIANPFSSDFSLTWLHVTQRPDQRPPKAKEVPPQATWSMDQWEICKKDWYHGYQKCLKKYIVMAGQLVNLPPPKFRPFRTKGFYKGQKFMAHQRISVLILKWCCCWCWRFRGTNRTCAYLPYNIGGAKEQGVIYFPTK